VSVVVEMQVAEVTTRAMTTTTTVSFAETNNNDSQDNSNTVCGGHNSDVVLMGTALINDKAIDSKGHWQQCWC
jgi:hypothetical protein